MEIILNRFEPTQEQFELAMRATDFLKKHSPINRDDKPKFTLPVQFQAVYAAHIAAKLAGLPTCQTWIEILTIPILLGDEPVVLVHVKTETDYFTFSPRYSLFFRQTFGPSL